MGPKLTTFQFAALVCLLFAGCGQQKTPPAPAPPPPIGVKLAPVKKGEATRSINLPGNVFPYQEAVLYAKVAGYVKSVLVDVGDAVKEGAFLADIEVPELLADRAKYQAELEVASIDFKRVSEAQTKAPDLI